MITFEATNGPYLRWLKQAEEKVGPRVWEIMSGLSSEHADVVLRSCGVIPFKHSTHLYKYIDAVMRDKGVWEDAGRPANVPFIQTHNSGTKRVSPAQKKKLALAKKAAAEAKEKLLRDAKANGVTLVPVCYAIAGIERVEDVQEQLPAPGVEEEPPEVEEESPEAEEVAE